MAQDIVSGLFGLSPNQVAQQQQQQIDLQAQNFAQLDPFQRAAQSMYQAGAGLGGIGAGMLGLVNPEVEAAKQREATLGQIDINTPDGLLQGAELARQRGDVRMQIQLQALAEQRKAELVDQDLKVAQAENFREVKNPTPVKPEIQEVGVEGKPGWRQRAIVNPDGSTIPVGAPYMSSQGGVGGGESKQPIAYIDPKTGRAVWGTMGQARGKVAAIYDPATKGYVAGAAKVGTGFGEMNMTQYEAATTAVSSIEDIDKLITHINTSDAITGMGADVYKNIERAKAILGDKVASGKASDTEILDVMMGSEVFPMIKSLGVGARGMDTPAEREFMRSVLTGSISLNKDTLLRMAKIRRDIAERSVNKWNSRVEKGDLDRFYEATGIPKEKIELKTSAGSNTQTWVRDATGRLVRGR